MGDAPGIGTTGLQGGKDLGRAGHLHDLAVGHAFAPRDLDLVVTGAGHEDAILVDQVLIGVDPLGIAGRDDEGIPRHQEGFGKGDVLAAAAHDVQPAGHDIDAARIQRGDQPAPIGHDDLDILMAHLGQQPQGIGVDEAHRFAIVAGIGKGGLVGKADADGLACLDPVGQGTGGGGRRKRHQGGAGKEFPQSGG